MGGVDEVCDVVGVGDGVVTPPLVSLAHLLTLPCQAGHHHAEELQEPTVTVHVKALLVTELDSGTLRFSTI